MKSAAGEQSGATVAGCCSGSTPGRQRRTGSAADKRKLWFLSLLPSFLVFPAFVGQCRTLRTLRFPLSREELRRRSRWSLVTGSHSHSTLAANAAARTGDLHNVPNLCRPVFNSSVNSLHFQVFFFSGRREGGWAGRGRGNPILLAVTFLYREQPHFLNNCPWNGWELMEGQTGKGAKAKWSRSDPVRTKDDGRAQHQHMTLEKQQIAA